MTHTPPDAMKLERPLPANAPAGFHLLAKPTGAICNLACSYCFFLDKELLYPGSPFRMTDGMLESYIRQLIESHRVPEVTVAWQGGEPTLMGVDFYRRSLEFENQYRKPGMTFQNTMQTNGTLLDDEWCEFFVENDYLIGISLDGPRHLHDSYRVNKGGAGTFDDVMRGLRLLQKHGVEYNVLTTINRVNAAHPLKVYRFLRDEVGTQWMQFIPVVERRSQDGLNLIQQGDTAGVRSVLPDQFGRFLIRIFDEWILNDVGQVYVMTFEAALRNWMRMPTSGMCVFEPTCGLGPALEHNGDLYACDHYVEPGYLLGNIHEDDMIELMASEKQSKFGRDKLDTLPGYCLECDVRFACHGECPKNRFIETSDGEPGLNYLCAGYKAFFHRVDEPMRLMAALMRTGRQAPQVMEILARDQSEREAAFASVKPAEPCPCGSQLTYRQCHGWKPSRRRKRVSSAVLGMPRPPVHTKM